MILEIKNDELFFSELQDIQKHTTVEINQQPLNSIIQMYLDEIFQFVEVKKPLTYNIQSLIHFRPIYEVKDGEEFLDSHIGKRFTDLCLYFVYVYWPKNSNNEK